FDGHTYARMGDGSWVDDRNIEAPTGLWSRLDRLLVASGLLPRRGGDRDPRTFRQKDAVRYFVRTLGEHGFHHRGCAAATERGAYGFCCCCGKAPRRGVGLHVIEDKRNAGEFFEYGADCWEGGMKPALAAALSAETDEGRARLMRENYRLFFEEHDESG